MFKTITKITLILCSIFVFGQQKSLENKISELTKNKNATIGISILGIDFPFEYHNENANKQLPTLSVFKFHVGLAILNQVDQGKLKLNQKYLIKKEQLLPDTHSPLRDEFPNGNVHKTLDELIRYTVAMSDNNTTDILLGILGGTKTVQKFLESKKIKDVNVKYTEEEMHKGGDFLYGNSTSTKSLANLYKQFYKGKILSKSSTDYYYQVLKSTSTGENKLKEQLPKGTVAHKTGSSGTDDNGFTIADNDGGIITLPNGKHYSIVIFVTDSKEQSEVNPKIISDVSKLVWDYLSHSKFENKFRN